MGKYGGLSGQYHYKTKKEAEQARKRVLELAGEPVTIIPMRGRVRRYPGYKATITGSRGFWTLTVTKKQEKRVRR